VACHPLRHALHQRRCLREPRAKCVCVCGGGDVAVTGVAVAVQASLGQAAEGAGKCTVTVVPLRHAQLDDEVAWLAGTVEALQAAGRPYLAAVAASSDGSEGVVDSAGPRFLTGTGTTSTSAASNATTASTTSIRIVPDIVTGLLVGLMLIFITLVGLQCTMSIATPDVMHTPDNKLPAGKEY